MDEVFLGLFGPRTEYNPCEAGSYPVIRATCHYNQKISDFRIPGHKAVYQDGGEFYYDI